MKKIVSVLLCLVMAMSLCTVAFAVATNHECWGNKQKPKTATTHVNYCSTCEKEYDVSDCVFDAKTGECACGNKKPAECKHEGGQNVVDNNDGKTHKVICPKCNAVITEKAEHVFDAKTGKCACGAVKAACDHVGGQNVVDNKDGMTHKVICTKCNAVITEKAEHVFDAKTGKCACGAVKAACDHVGVQNVVDNKDGKTHKVICPKCDAVITEKAEHVFDAKTGKCACGAEKPACKHEGAQKLVPNKDKKTHNAYCPVCNELMAEKIPHTYQYDKNGEFVGRGGKYCLCGAKKPASSGGSTTGTTTATTKSPKTGDMGVVLYAATALLSLSGTAVVIKKRKNDK